MSIKPLWNLFRQTLNEWSEDKVPRLGAALAYYSVFSITPLLVIVIALAGVVFGRDAAQTQIVNEIQSVVGPQVGEAIGGMLKDASEPASGVTAIVTGIVVLLIGATGAFGQLQDSLNTIWEVAPKPGRRWWDIIRERFLSLTIVLGVAFLLLVSLVISAALAAAGEVIGNPSGHIAGRVLHAIVTFGLITVLFAMIFKILPDAMIAWKDVWIGAAVTSFLFGVGKFLISLYLTRSRVTSGYGAAGSLVIILVWVYYSSQILLLGAEFTQVYANRFGKRIRPASNAVSLTCEDRAQQGIPTYKDLGLAADRNALAGRQQ